MYSLARRASPNGGRYTHIMGEPERGECARDVGGSHLCRMGSGSNRDPALKGSELELGFVEGLDSKILVLQRRADGLRGEEHLRLKILTLMRQRI